jgi:methionyl aminopeptidase
VHGIPRKEIVFKKGDVVSVDVGIFYKGFHTDTALTVYLGQKKEIKNFLKAGKEAMLAGIKKAKKGNKIGDISRAIEKRLFESNLRPIWALTGHGIGKELHEEPNIPCFTSADPVEETPIVEGMTLAVEVMYTNGKGDLKLDKDGWTLRTKDGRIAGLWEETVAITSNGSFVLTD